MSLNLRIDVKDMNAAAKTFSSSLNHKLVKESFFWWRLAWQSKQKRKKVLIKRYLLLNQTEVYQGKIYGFHISILKGRYGLMSFR